MKYILFEDFSGKPSPIIFPNRIEFDEMREQMPYTRVLGAGYVEMEGRTRCYGKATSIQAEAGEGDAEVIQRYFAEETE
ncbi:MAG: hypothetical protein H0S85_16280 [Desulfovibrionaceae bacterium]|jgi:hypothetical protein|nr:hypothetical protein [Desulfovibrionaceae bacterium]